MCVSYIGHMRRAQTGGSAVWISARINTVRNERKRQHPDGLEGRIHTLSTKCNMFCESLLFCIRVTLAVNLNRYHFRARYGALLSFSSESGFYTVSRHTNYKRLSVQFLFLSNSQLNHPAKQWQVTVLVQR